MPRKKTAGPAIPSVNPTQEEGNSESPNEISSNPRVIPDRALEAEYSFAFLVDVRNDAEVPLAKRIECAELIMDRVLGKPSQGATDDVPPSAKAMIEKYYEAIGEGRRKTEDR